MTAVLKMFKAAMQLDNVVCKQVGDLLIVEGFASTTDLDHTNEIVSEAGLRSLAKSLKKQTTVLFNHDTRRPIGKLLILRVQDAPGGKKGLWVQISISKAEHELWEKIQDGTISKFSWAGRVLELREETNPDGSITIFLDKIKGFEVSLVSIPANNMAEVTDSRVGKFLMMEGATMKGAIKETNGSPLKPAAKPEGGEGGNSKENTMKIEDILKKVDAQEKLNDEEKKMVREYLKSLKDASGEEPNDPKPDGKDGGKAPEGDPKPAVDPAKKDGDDAAGDAAKGGDTEGDKPLSKFDQVLKAADELNKGATDAIQKLTDQAKSTEEKQLDKLTDVVGDLVKNQKSLFELMTKIPQKSAVIPEQTQQVPSTPATPAQDDDDDNEDSVKNFTQTKKYKNADRFDKVQMLKDALNA